MSSERAKRYHSVTFGGKNTWDDFGIVPTSRPVFAPPQPKTNYLEIPGADGTLDISEALTGYPVYSNREGSMEFVVLRANGKRWYDVYSEISSHLHGRYMQAVLDDEPDFYYEGRFSVNQWASEKDYSKITIDYNVKPYKWGKDSLDENWLWDPFNFEKDIIRYSVFGNIYISSNTSWTTKSLDAALTGTAPFCPEFIVNTNNGNGMDVRFENPDIGISETTHIPDGRTTVYDFIMGGGGDGSISFKGRGYVSIHFIEGRL